MSGLGDILVTQGKLEARHQTSKAVDLIDDLIAQLEHGRSALALQQKSPQGVTQDIKASLATFQKAITEDQKETYNAQAKHGKAISKRFKVDLATATQPNVFVGKEHLINNAIALNFIRQGQFDIAMAFAQEANLEIDKSLVQNFETMYTIIQSLDRNDLSEAIAWATHNRALLQERNSTLEFELHKTEFITIFKTSHVFECIEYAQRHFAVFAATHLKEIQQLMASTAYHASITTSPYASLFADSTIESNTMDGVETRASRHDWVKRSFITEFTALLHMTPTSPLQTTIEAADLALPTLIKLSALKQTTRATGDAERESTGVDLPLPKEFRFHSVFVCPVTKEVGGDAWMLGCGHVIGGEAMYSLAKGTQKLKCPYCPAISELRDGIKLIL